MTNHKLITIELTIEGISRRRAEWVHNLMLWLVVLLGGKAAGGVGNG